MVLSTQVNVCGSFNQSSVERQRLFGCFVPSPQGCSLKQMFVFGLSLVLVQCCSFAGYVANVPIIEPWGHICTCPWMALSQDSGAPEIHFHPCHWPVATLTSLCSHLVWDRNDSAAFTHSRHWAPGLGAHWNGVCIMRNQPFWLLLDHFIETTVVNKTREKRIKKWKPKGK